jgi:hypothetical protein
MASWGGAPLAKAAMSRDEPLSVRCMYIYGRERGGKGGGG